MALAIEADRGCALVQQQSPIHDRLADRDRSSGMIEAAEQKKYVWLSKMQRKKNVEAHLSSMFRNELFQ